MKSPGLCLLCTLTCCVVAFARPGPAMLELPPLPVRFHSLPGRSLAVEPRQPEPGGLVGGGATRWIRGCGAGVLQPAERISGLRDPVGELAAAFRACHGLRAERLDPRIPVADFPAGHFGGWVRDGWLVTQRAVFSDEATLRWAFALLVETVGEPEDPLDWLFELPAGESALVDDRLVTGFVPDMVWVFVGGVPLEIEISLAQERVLVRAGDHWAGFGLDRLGAASLRDCLATAARSPVAPRD